jgi:hypothetical protein
MAITPQDESDWEKTVDKQSRGKITTKNILTLFFGEKENWELCGGFLHLRRIQFPSAVMLAILLTLILAVSLAFETKAKASVGNAKKGDRGRCRYRGLGANPSDPS